jgi:diguanylate cyclase (GGDEF)-like protein/PAS domain S-box-containing protein
MLEEKPPLRLLFIGLSTDNAQKIISAMRGAGYGTRPNQCNDLDKALELLETEPLDLVFMGPKAPLEPVVDHIASLNRDMPVIAVGASLDAEAFAEAIGKGARDFIALEPKALVQHVVTQQFNDLLTRRRVRELESQLRESERRNHTLLDSSKDAIAYVHEGMHVYANPAYLEMFHVTGIEDIEGFPILDLASSGDADGLKAVLRKLSKGEDPPEKLELRAQRSDGTEFDAQMHFSHATVDGEPCTQVLVYDRAMAPELAEELEELKTLDLITGLANRQTFIDRLDEAAQHQGEGESLLSVLYLRPDNFSNLVQSIGLANMDVLLKDLADVIKGQLGDQDVGCRFSEHDFVILSKERKPEDAEALANQLLKAFEKHIAEIGKHSANLTISIGLVIVGEAAPSAHDMINQAAECCMRMGREGGNKFMRYNPAADARSLSAEDGRWQTLVRHALKNDGFRLVYQPIVSLDGSEGSFYRTYLRLVTEDGEQDISPASFMKAVENEQLITRIDRWVVGRAIRIIQQYGKSNEQFTLFVRVSAETLEDDTFMPWLAKALQQTKISGQSLVFELAESDVVTHVKPAGVFVSNLRKVHARVALSEYGSGLNSGQLLKHLKPDFVKIDPSFTRDLAKNEESEQKVTEFTQAAHAAGKLIIAEFIEDANSMSVLWRVGVNFAQGNFLQPPQDEPSYDPGA